MRTYTVRALRPAVAELDIEFVLHGVNGPASAWVSDVELGPRGRPDRAVLGRHHQHQGTAELRRRLRARRQQPQPRPGRRRDRAARARGILEQLPAAVRATVFVEVPDVRDIRPLPTPGEADVTWITHGETDRCLRPSKRPSLPFDVDYAWVAGESGMIKQVRRHLVNTVGLPKAADLLPGLLETRRSPDLTPHHPENPAGGSPGDTVVQLGFSAWVRVSQATNRLFEPAGRLDSVRAWVLAIAIPSRVCRAL